MKWLLRVSALVLLITLPAAAAEVRLTQDAKGVDVQNVYRLGTTHTVVITGEKAQVNALSKNTNVVRIVCSVACHISQGATPATATTSSALFPANEVFFLRVTGHEDSISVIRDSTDGTLYVTEMN